MKKIENEKAKDYQLPEVDVVHTRQLHVPFLVFAFSIFTSSSCVEAGEVAGGSEKD